MFLHLGNTSLVKCVPLPGKHISLVICSYVNWLSSFPPSLIAPPVKILHQFPTLSLLHPMWRFIFLLSSTLLVTHLWSTLKPVTSFFVSGTNILMITRQMMPHHKTGVLKPHYSGRKRWLEINKLVEAERKLKKQNKKPQLTWRKRPYWHKQNTGNDLCVVSAHRAPHLLCACNCQHRTLTPDT